MVCTLGGAELLQEPLQPRFGGREYARVMRDLGALHESRDDHLLEVVR